MSHVGRRLQLLVLVVIGLLVASCSSDGPTFVDAAGSFASEDVGSEDSMDDGDASELSVDEDRAPPLTTTYTGDASKTLVCELAGEDVMDSGPGMVDPESGIERGQASIEEEIADWRSPRFNSDWEIRKDWHSLELGLLDESGSRARAYFVDADFETKLILTITLQPDGLWLATDVQSCDPP